MTHLIRTAVFCLCFLPLVSPLFAQPTGPWQQRVDSDIRVALDDVNHVLNGDIVITYHNESPDALDVVWMHLWPNAYRNGQTAMAKQHFRDGDMLMFYALSRELGGIDSLAFTSNGGALEWSYHPEHIDIARVELPQPLAPGDSLELRTPFRVDLPSGSISRLGHVGESYQITQWFPKPAVYDAEGWHPMPYLSQGEFYSEYGSYDVRLTLPANYTVGATGDLVPGSEDNEAERVRLDSLVTASVKWVASEGWLEDNNDFPESEDQLKTLHYRQSRVHDFAWFADKRYKVLRGEVELPGQGTKVTTWSMFTPEEGALWQKAPEYLHDATFYYSLWNGDYPYNQVTAVDGTISAGGGMEYPNVTVIGASGSDSGLETVIVHEVGHNWFYGILGSNERENAWMDEGINSFNETRYMVTKYGDDNSISFLLGNGNNLARRLELEDFKYRWIDELSYLFPARFGVDQPIQCHSNSLTQLNYGAIVYKKTAAAFAMLQAHLGAARFDAAMQLYFDTWKFRHPSPKDLQACMEASSGEDLAWFFEGWIQSTKRNDLALVKANPRRGLVVKNKGSLSSSSSLSAMRGDSVVRVISVPLLAPGQKTSVDMPALDGIDRWMLDRDRVGLDYDRRNNQRRAKGFLKPLEPLQFRLLSRLEDPEATQLFWLPALGWNAHNGLMLGMTFHNLTLPPRDLTWQWTPLLSNRQFGQGLDFGGMLSFDWRKNAWHVGLRSSQFRAQEALQMPPEITIPEYDGELLTRTSWHVERRLNARPTSPWSANVGYEGIHMYGFVDPAPDAYWTLVPNSGGVRLQRRASWLHAELDHAIPNIPGMAQSISAKLGRMVTHGWRYEGILIEPPVASASYLKHNVVDVWHHWEYARPRRTKEHRWTFDSRAAWVFSTAEEPGMAGARTLDVPDYGIAVAGPGAHYDPLADVLLLNRGGGMTGADGGWTGRQAALDRGGLPLKMVAPQGLGSIRAGYTHPWGVEVFAGAAVAWDEGRDEVSNAPLAEPWNAVVGLAMPLGPLEVQLPLWLANVPANGGQPWSGWMFKLDLMSLNPLKLARENLQ